MKTKRGEEGIDRFIRFIKRIQEEGWGGSVGIINLDPKTNEVSVLKIKNKPKGAKREG